MQPLFPVPSPSQLAWQRLETTAFFHLGVNTFTGREWGDGTESPEIFNPTHLDCRQWARAAKAGGLRLGILTAKHHDGFCLWPSRFTDHTVAASPWRQGGGDLVREFVDAFRAEGLLVGLYLSPWDRHEPTYGDSPRYNDFYCNQLTELLTQYGPLHEVWFDGACAEGTNGRKQEYDWARFFSLVKELQPEAVTFGDGGTTVRWVGNERGFANDLCWATTDPRIVRFPGDSGISQANDATATERLKSHFGSGEPPDSTGKEPRIWQPAECDVSIRPGWFYHSSEDDQVRSVEDLVDLYFKSVGRNSLLLLNLPPTPEGLVHEADVAAVQGMRKALDRIFRHDLALGCEVIADSAAADHPASRVVDGDLDTFWTPASGATRASLELRWSAFHPVHTVSLRESISWGQRIAEYEIDLQDRSGHWITVSRGTTIGCRKLDRFDPVEASSLRLRILSSLAEPALTAVEIFA